MRRGFASQIFTCTLLVVATVFAQTGKGSFHSVWKLDPEKSDLGEGAPKSLTITVLSETPQIFSWRVHGIDDKGKTFSYSWSGPEDGSMHSVMQGGKEDFKESAKKDGDGALLRHGEEADGSSFDARATLSEDGKTMTDEVTEKSKDGKETKTKWVYHRSSDPH